MKKYNIKRQKDKKEKKKRKITGVYCKGEKVLEF